MLHYTEQFMSSTHSNYPTDGVYVKSYLPTDDSLTEKVSFIKQAISDLPRFDIPIGRNEVTLSEVHEEDWSTAWKKYYKPVKVSERITIKPTWEEYQPSSDELIIELDPEWLLVQVPILQRS